METWLKFWNNLFLIAVGIEIIICVLHVFLYMKMRKTDLMRYYFIGMFSSLGVTAFINLLFGVANLFGNGTQWDWFLYPMFTISIFAFSYYCVKLYQYYKGL